MRNFREFEAGPDPFGRTWQVQFKWLQTAISIRHSDSVDAKFRLRCGEETAEKVVAMRHPDLLELSRKTGQELTDPWCSRMAALHLKYLIETGGDLEQELVTMTPRQLEAAAETLAVALAPAARG